MAACSSLASVGKVMAFGCTVVSTVTRLRSWPRNAPASCATRRLSASSNSSLSPSRLRQWLRSERSCGKACWKNSAALPRERDTLGDEPLAQSLSASGRIDQQQSQLCDFVGMAHEKDGADGRTVDIGDPAALPRGVERGQEFCHDL